MRRVLFAALLTLTCSAYAIQAAGQNSISAEGVIESTSGGFKFPDGTVQTTASEATEPSRPFVVREALADLESSTLVLVGGIFEAPIVTFGDSQIELTNLSVTTNVLTTDLPTDLIPGDYQITVEDGSTVSLLVTLGPSRNPGFLYLNGLLKDANGKAVGFWWYGSKFVSFKGYWFNLYFPTPGYYRNLAVFFESNDCTGQPYTWVDPLPGEVFVAHDGFDSHYVAYSKLDAIPTIRTTNSLRRYNGTYGHGYCETPKTYTDEYVPVYPNNPEVTGIPGDLGNRDNPYPAPLTIEN